MNELNPDLAPKTKWAFFRKKYCIGCIIGATIGSVLTILSIVKNNTSDSHDLGGAILLGIVSTPSLPLLVVLGHFGLKFINLNGNTAWTFIVVVNAISYATIGLLIGGFIDLIQFKR
jgi:hypothetical protein